VDVGAWLHGLGLGQYKQAFRDNDIGADLLPTVASLGHRKLLLTAIATLAGPADPRPSPAPPVPPPASASPQAERRQLTVVFVDLVGSTALSSRLDPEDMQQVLHAYQNTVTGEIARIDGHVAKLMGDGVLAYFGWPRAHEDDADRAVRAGLALAEAVGRLHTPAGEPLAARVGIATGLVVVGDLVGEGVAREEAVVGETPNLAARLQEAATPGAVVVADGTRRLLGEVFDLRKLGPIRLKGFAHPVGSFEVLCERPAESRFEAWRSGRPPPMVGRDQELALVLERWRQAVAGEGQAVLLVGEAGIGKSRLVRAALDAVAGHEHTALRLQCSPHHTGTALWPVVQQLGFAAGLAPVDTEAARLDKLEVLLRRGTEDLDEAAPLIAALLGIDFGARYPALDLSSRRRRARTLAVLIEQLLGLARLHPVLLVLEDAHWTDPTTLELVEQVLDRIAEARLLMLLTSRPDGQPTLGGHPHVTRLTLNRLGRGPTEAIVAHLTGGRGLPPEVLGEITARTDGVPLFVEELTKAVLEVGAAGAAAVPDSLHASLIARLDRVPGVKEVAQAAACVGREFTYTLLAAVSPLPETELQAALERLAAGELVFRRGTPPEASYVFKHALVRDAVHESLLKAERQRLHARIARVLEERFPAVAEVQPEMLARHYTDAGLAEKAVAYRHKAGERAVARAAMKEAVVQLTAGLEALKDLPEGLDRDRRELDLRLALGQALIAAKGFGALETGRTYARARELCRGLGDVPELFPALYGRSVHHFQRGELAAAHKVARELLRSAKERGDDAAQVTGHRVVGSALFQLGRLVESRGHFEAGLALYDPVRDQTSAFTYAIDSRVICLSWLSHLLVILGHPGQALARNGEALAYARERAHPNTVAVALSWGCILHQLLRDRRNARKEAEAVMALATEQGFPLYLAAGTVVRGWALPEGERAEEDIAEIRRGFGRLWSHRGREMVALLPGPARRGAGTGGPSRGWPEPCGRCRGPSPPDGRALDRGRPAPAPGRAAAAPTRAGAAQGGGLLPPSPGRRPRAGCENVGAARHDEPRPPMARPG
jgi:class 3 adenylate cyclase/tetratricopeptide (TPR) repeat protein